MNTDRTSPLIVAKNMAAIAQRQAAIAQCKRQIDALAVDIENDFWWEGVDFWREVADHLENTNFD